MSSGSLDYRTDPWLRTPEPLLWLGGSGHETRGDSSYSFNAATRSDKPHACLQFTLAGQGYYQDCNGRSALPVGWAWFNRIPGEFEYGYHPASPRPYELVYLSLAGPVATEWHERITRTFGHVLQLGIDSAVAPLMLSIAHAVEANTLPDRYLQSAQLYQLLMTLYSTLNRSRLNMAPRVTRALELIATHAGDAAFGVTQLAGMLDCSREHLARLFVAAIGVSPNDYLTQHRLRLAARALRSTDEKLESLARRCGFSGANYLVRTFREHIGATPAKFRKQPWIVGP